MFGGTKSSIKKRIVVRRTVRSMFGEETFAQLRTGFRLHGKQKGHGSIPIQVSLLFEKVVVCGHCLVTLSLTINVTLKWLSSLPILMQESCWW